MTERLATAAARHPWRTVGAWLVAASSPSSRSPCSSEMRSPARPSSSTTRSRSRPTADRPAPATRRGITTDVILVRANREATAARASGPATGGGERTPRRARRVLRRRQAGRPGRSSAVVYAAGLEDEEVCGRRTCLSFVRPEDALSTSSPASGQSSAIQTLSLEDLQKGELQFGLPVAFIVLLLVFGAVVAGLVPVALAIVAIITAVGLGRSSALVRPSVFTINMSRDGARAGDRLLPVRRVPLPGGALRRTGQARRNRRDRRHSEPRRALQRLRLRHRDARAPAHPEHDLPQPRRRREPGRPHFGGGRPNPPPRRTEPAR